MSLYDLFSGIYDPSAAQQKYQPQSLFGHADQELVNQQLALWHAEQAPMFKAKGFSQNWLNAMLDVELGL